MMTNQDFENYIKQRSKIIDDEHKIDREAALRQAWLCIDNAIHNVWADAGKAAYMAIKYEIRYDQNATLWKELPKVLYEYMLIKL